MNIIAVDDNKIALETLVNQINAAIPGNRVNSFTMPSKALEYIKGQCAELKLAFLDVEMPGMNGIELAANIKILFPRAVIMFVTAFPQYSFQAYKVHASGYLIKPITSQMLKTELEALPQPTPTVTAQITAAVTATPTATVAPTTDNGNQGLMLWLLIILFVIIITVIIIIVVKKKKADENDKN